jgi:hypothetical protein
MAGGPDLAGLSFRIWLLPKWGCPASRGFREAGLFSRGAGAGPPFVRSVNTMAAPPFAVPEGWAPQTKSKAAGKSARAT